MEDVAAVPMFPNERTELISERVRGFDIPMTLTTPRFLEDYWIKEA
jgi:hypothetical protein